MNLELQKLRKQHLEGLSTSVLNQELKSGLSMLDQLSDRLLENLKDTENKELLSKEENYPAIRDYMIRNLKINLQFEELRIKKSNASVKLCKTLASEERQLAQEQNRAMREVLATLNQNDPIHQALNQLEGAVKSLSNLAHSMDTFSKAFAEQLDNLSPQEISKVGKQFENIGTILANTGSALEDISSSNEESDIPELRQEASVFSAPNAITFFPSETRVKALKSASELVEDQSPRGSPPQ